MTITTSQLRRQPGGDWSAVLGAPADPGAQLVLAFGPRAAFVSAAALPELRERFPQARIVACSSDTTILDDGVHEALTATALRFDATRVEAATASIDDAASSADVGAALARALPAAGLRHVLLLSDGLVVNGSALARGVADVLPAGVTVSGGLAADGELFARTLVGLDAEPEPHRVVAIGLYGDRLVVGLGSVGGWTATGGEIVVTRAEHNVVHELAGEPALTVYKRRIGAHAYGLPASGLLYPLRIPRDGADAGAADARAADADSGDLGLVRTLLGVDQAAGTLTFAGDVPQGAHVRLMRADLDDLIAASGAAATTAAPSTGAEASFALLVSCIGRRLLLQRRVGEEIASARAALGPTTAIAGFYAYGELAPATAGQACALHNQTMTVTTLAER